MSSRAEEFMDMYRKLETAAVEEYSMKNDGSAVYRLARRPEFRNLTKELDYCREVRNLLSHKPKAGNDYAVEPTEGMLNLLKMVLEEVKRPLRSRDIAVDMKSVLSASLDDPVLPILKQMNDRSIAMIPVLKKGAVVGAFGEKTLLKMLLAGNCSLDEKTTFAMIAENTELCSYAPICFKFVAEETLAAEVSEMFDAARKDHVKIEMVFVTEGGLPDGKLRGIITAWDVAAYATDLSAGFDLSET